MKGSLMASKDERARQAQQRRFEDAIRGKKPNPIQRAREVIKGASKK